MYCFFFFSNIIVILKILTIPLRLNFCTTVLYWWRQPSREQLWSTLFIRIQPTLRHHRRCSLHHKPSSFTRFFEMEPTRWLQSVQRPCGTVEKRLILSCQPNQNTYRLTTASTPNEDLFAFSPDWKMSQLRGNFAPRPCHRIEEVSFADVKQSKVEFIEK